MLETPRLSLRELSVEDAEFIVRLLNEPSFIRSIGDRGVRTADDARTYIRQGPIDSYERHGFGLYLVELKERRVPIGICGLLKREFLDDVDVGFALLPEFWSQGYAFEAASAVIARARDDGFTRVLAITSQENDPSIRLLRKLGFYFERLAKTSDTEPELKVFAADL